MNIKIQRMNKLEGSKVLAFVDLIFEGCMVVKGFKVVQGEKGLFIGKPSEKGKDDQYFNTVKFLTEDIENEVEKVVLESYNRK